MLTDPTQVGPPLGENNLRESTNQSKSLCQIDQSVTWKGRDDWGLPSLAKVRHKNVAYLPPRQENVNELC